MTRRLQAVFVSALLTNVLLLTSCSTVSETEKSGMPHNSKQPNDGDWVMNIPGKPHTHRVVLAECPDKPVITTHRHTRNQNGANEHKHRGCFICPPKNPLIKRITSH